MTESIRDEMNKHKENLRERWSLSQGVNINHGSFGATPKAILERQAKMSADINSNREGFIWGAALESSALARAKIAAFIGADAEDTVFVDNATEGFNTVIRSLPLGPGDEVLVTDHIYANFPPPLAWLAKRQGFEVRTVKIPYPPQDPEQIKDTILSAVTDKTKLVVIDHISSATAILFPVMEIVAALNERGVDTFVDGAHAPGQVSLNMKDIGAAYYTGNHHKWVCAPWSSAFLHVRKDRQENIMPVVASGWAKPDNPFAERFAWQGTRDFTARLCVPETIDYMASLHPGGWHGIIKRNHDMAVRVRDSLCGALKIPKPCPDDMFGSMFTLPLGPLEFPEEKEQPGNLYSIMEKKYGHRAYAAHFNGQYLLRVSCHLYNEEKDYKRLPDVIRRLIKEHGSAALRPDGVPHNRP